MRMMKMGWKRKGWMKQQGWMRQQGWMKQQGWSCAARGWNVSPWGSHHHLGAVVGVGHVEVGD